MLSELCLVDNHESGQIILQRGFDDLLLNLVEEINLPEPGYKAEYHRQVAVEVLDRDGGKRKINQAIKLGIEFGAKRPEAGGFPGTRFSVKQGESLDRLKILREKLMLKNIDK